MHLVYPVVVSALLFSLGVYGVLARRNAICVLLALELMLNAVNLDLVAFDAYLRDTVLHAGQVFALFVVTVAAGEVGLGLAIVLAVYRARESIAVDQLRDLADSRADDAADGQPGPAVPAAARSGVGR